MDDSANKLRKSSRKQLQSNKSTTDTPTFEPDAKMGEGTASDTELSFRKALIDLNQPIYDIIIKGIKENEGSLTKQLAIVDEQTALLLKQGTPIILATDKSMTDDFVTIANSNLKKITPTIKQIKPDLSDNLSILQDEQADDWKNICDDLNYKIKSGLRQQALTNNLHTKPAPSTKAKKKPKKKVVENDYDYVNVAFNQTQQRQDGLGWYGYSQASLIGLHGTYFNAIAAGLVIGSGGAIVSDLVADWVSQGDSDVCPDCEDLEAGGPYSIFNWPQDPHFGCRCYQSAPYVLSANT
jgi:hypothetical protein